MPSPYGVITTFDVPGATRETFALSINRAITGYYYTRFNYYYGFVLTP